VDAGWETAVETVLGSLLEAATVDAPEGLLDAVAGFAKGRLALLSNDAGDVSTPADSLAARVRGPRAARQWLAKIRVADDLAEARAKLATLARTKPSSPALANGWDRAGCA
jgi:chromosome segregation protein